MLTLDAVEHSDPFVLIGDAVESERIHSFARYLHREQRRISDPRMDLAREVLSAALCVHPDEVTMLSTSAKPGDLAIGKPLGGLLIDIYQPLVDLPQTLWEALLIELGNGESLHALTILQSHHNTVTNIIRVREQRRTVATAAD